MHHIQGVIFDIDGVLVYQGHVLPGAVETVDALRRRGLALRFLTNSTLKSRASCAAGLRRKGFHVLDEECITASSATAAYLRERQARSCWLMLERSGVDEFEGIAQDAENPEYVVVGDNRSRFDFEHLNHAYRLLLNGARLVGMQGELTDCSMGEPELNVGSWVGMLERATGVQATYVGKPNPYAFQLALGSMSCSLPQWAGRGEGSYSAELTRRVVMVGDRVSTDVKGAQAFGLWTILVKTGEFREPDLDGTVQPDFVVDSMSDILAVLDGLD